MIAISYRRDDSLPIAGRLYDRLQAEFGKGNVFMDFDSIPYGVDFRDHIKKMIERSKVLVAMIGPDWIGKRRHRTRRIDDPTDFVRLEISYALERKLPIIPILVGNTRMPRPEDLPKDIEGLAFRNALSLDVGIDFHHHAERLIGAIDRLLSAKPSPPPAVKKPETIEAAPAVQGSLTPPEAHLASPQVPTPSTTGLKASEQPVLPPKSDQPLAKAQPPAAVPEEKVTKEATAKVPPRPPRVSRRPPKSMASPPAILKPSPPPQRSPPAETPKLPDQKTETQSAKNKAEDLRSENKPPATPTKQVGTNALPEVQPPKKPLSDSMTGPTPPRSDRSTHSKPQAKSSSELVKDREARTPPRLPKQRAFLAHLQSTIAHLQDKVMADYTRPLNSDRLQRPMVSAGLKKIATLLSVCLVILVLAGGIWYWGFRRTGQGNANDQVTRPAGGSQQARIAKTTQPPAVVPQPSQGALSARSVQTPSASLVPLHGTLSINSTPEGQIYAVMDAKGTQHIGTTPATLQNLPVGYAEVIFKRAGFTDHREAVWLASNVKPSVTWNFPENTRILQPTPVKPTDNLAIRPTLVSPSSPIPSPLPNPAAQNHRPWQEWITDFVKQFMAVNQLQDANATVAFYGPSVDYFGSRDKDQAFILRDVQKYNVQWPRRQDSINGDIHLEEKVPNQQYRAKFNLKFYAENPSPAEWSNGEVAMTIDIDLIDGVPKIAAINEKRLQHHNGRGKGPRPPELEAALRPINPKKLTKVFVKKYGFSALLPTDLFPDAETKLSDGVTDRISSARGCATVIFGSSREALRKVYDDDLARYQAAPDHRSIDYKVIKDNWFVVSAGTRTTGYYTKGVQHGDDVFLMELEYAGRLCNIPNATLTRISRAFDGN
jgi:hypothetical protein